MTVLELEAARVTDEEVRRTLHILAAANHYQWGRLERYVIPHLERGDKKAIAQLLAGEYSKELEADLLRYAGDITDIVRSHIGGYIYPAEAVQLLARKCEQLTHWIEYAEGCPATDYERWKLQSRTPFQELPVAMCASDYEQAVLDLQAVCDAAGLVLPRRLPDIRLLNKPNNRPARCLHLFGRRGPFVTSDRPWHFECMACGRDWHIEHP